MNWFKRTFQWKRGAKSENRESKGENRSSIVDFPSSNFHSPSSFNHILFLFLAAKVCAVALLAVSGTLWLAWAAQSTFQQADWAGGAIAILILAAMGTGIRSGMLVVAGAVKGKNFSGYAFFPGMIEPRRHY